MVHSGSIVSEGSEHTGSIIFDITIETSAAPTAKVAVVAVTVEGELLVDGTVVKLQSQLPNPVRIIDI